MKTARFDRGALIAGFVFVMLGVVFLLDELDVIRLRAAYVLPVVLIVAGVMVLVGALTAGRSEA